MEKLNEKLWSIVKEYTMQVAKLLDCDEWHWIGTDDDGEKPIDVCDFDGSMFLSLEEMQIIIDRLDEWVKRYGSKEAVAQEIRDWIEWWMKDSDSDNPDAAYPDPIVEIYENRLNRYQRTYPRINLENWLAGCPREPRPQTIDDEIRRLVCQRGMVKVLISKYREARSLWNVLESLSAEIKAKKAIKEKRDAKLQEDMKQTDAYRNFEQAIKEHKEQGGEF